MARQVRVGDEVEALSDKQNWSALILQPERIKEKTAGDDAKVLSLQEANEMAQRLKSLDTSFLGTDKSIWITVDDKLIDDLLQVQRSLKIRSNIGKAELKRRLELGSSDTFPMSSVTTACSMRSA